MQLLKKTGLIVLCIGLLVIPGPSFAQAAQPACALSGVVLDCSGGKRKPRMADIAAAFSSQQTRDLLANPHKELERFTTRKSRETFRKSIEKSWRAINRYDRVSRKALKRKRITDEEYLARVAQHKEAQKTYDAAYWFYKSLIWQLP